MLEKFQEIVYKFEEIERKLSDPEIISNQDVYKDLVKNHSELSAGVTAYKTYQKLETELSESEQMLNDPEMGEMAKEEIVSIKQQMSEINNVLVEFLLPKDVNDTRNAIIEIRCGTGGDEAALFAADLYRMYSKYCEIFNWSIELLSENITELGGVKEITFLVSGKNVFKNLKFESGTHRVQRVPDTEASGRIHTSAATVAILPEAEDVDIQIDMKDIRVDVYRASGAGGQHVNKTSSAVRLTHEPSGVVVACQDERSQHQNKDKALRILKTKLYDLEMQKKAQESSDIRKYQVGSGDRSEKIRTYNFPQNRITDHRINFTVYNMDEVLQGKLQPIIDELLKEEQLKKMKSL